MKQSFFKWLILFFVVFVVSGLAIPNRLSAQEEGLSNASDSLAALKRRAKVAEDTGRLFKARELYEKILKKEQDSDASRALSRVNRRIEKARALREDGKRLIKEKRYKEALYKLQASLEYFPDKNLKEYIDKYFKAYLEKEGKNLLDSRGYGSTSQAKSDNEGPINQIKAKEPRYKFEKANYWYNDFKIYDDFHDMQECARLCDENPDCVVATFHGPNGPPGWKNKCILRNAIGPRHTDQPDTYSWIK